MRRNIKIELTEPINLDSNSKDLVFFKIQLIEKIKDILNTTDLEDFQVYEEAGLDIQDIKLKINNKK